MTRSRARCSAVLVCALALAAGACDTASSPDAAGTDGGGIPDGSRVVSPSAPAWPSLTPCPDGWSLLFAHPDAPECEPWSASTGEEWCPRGELRVPGAGCAPIGSACPADGWPAELPPAAVHVSASAVPGGDGSRGAPFGTIADALGALGGGGTIALSVGEYDEVVTLSGAVELRGACPTETFLTSSIPGAAAGDAVVTVTGTGAVLRDLAIQYPPRAAVTVLGGGELTVRGVAIYAPRGAAVIVAGELAADHVLVQEVSSEAGRSRGVSVEGAGRATLRQVVLEGANEVGAFASATATLRLEDASIRGPASDDVPFFFDTSVGVAAVDGGRIELVRSVVERQTGAGARAYGGGQLVFEDVLLRDDRQEGIRLDEEGHASLRRVTIGPGHSSGLLLYQRAELDAEDLIVRGTVYRSLDVLVGSSAELRRVLFAGTGDIGVMVHGEGSALTAEDLVVEDTRGDVDDRASGRGLNVQGGASADVTRARFERNRGVAVFLSGSGAVTTLRDVTVLDTRSEIQDGRFGTGLNVQTGTHAEVERIRIEGSRGAGIVVDGAQLGLRDARVEGTRVQDCAGTTCADTAGGTGLGAYRGATLDVAAFEVVGSPLCGVQLAGGAEVDLTDGLVAHGLIGACVQVDGYDISRLEEGVLYLGNEVNLDSAEQYVPETLLPADPSGP